MTKPTKSAVEKLKYDPNGPTHQFTWFSDPPGFGVQVFESGRKSFVLSTRVNGRKRRRVLKSRDVTNAAKEARGLLVDIDRGENPFERAGGGVTLRRALNAWIRLPRRRNGLKPRTEAQTSELMGRYVPDWLDEPIAQITRKRVTERYLQIADGQWVNPETGRQIGTPNQAMKVFAAMRTVINHAIAQGGDGAPTENVVLVLGSRLQPESREDEDELPENETPWSEPQLRTLGDTLLRFWPQGLPEPDRWLTLWLAFTGCRRTESARLTWSMVESDAVVIPSVETKNAMVHRVPKTRQIRWLLDQLPREGDRLFSVERDGKFIAGTVREALGDDGEWYRAYPNHRWRHTLASVLADEIDVSERTIAALLNHRKSRSITAHYAHKPVDFPKRLNALQAANDWLGERFGME